MKNLNAVSLNFGLNADHERRFIGFHEGPYARTAQIAVPKDWAVSAFIEHDDVQASRTYDERRRTIYCIAIHPNGNQIIAYKWRVGSRTNPMHLIGKDAEEVIEDLNNIDHEKIVKKIVNLFGV